MDAESFWPAVDKIFAKSSRDPRFRRPIARINAGCEGGTPQVPGTVLIGVLLCAKVEGARGFRARIVSTCDGDDRPYPHMTVTNAVTRDPNSGLYM